MDGLSSPALEEMFRHLKIMRPSAVSVTEQSEDSLRCILACRRTMGRRLLRSVTWTEVDAVFAAEIPFSTLPDRVARLGRRLVNLRASIPWIRRHS
jgi:hypothetical protein